MHTKIVCKDFSGLSVLISHYTISYILIDRQITLTNCRNDNKIEKYLIIVKIMSANLLCNPEQLTCLIDVDVETWLDCFPVTRCACCNRYGNVPFVTDTNKTQHSSQWNVQFVLT